MEDLFRRYNPNTPPEERKGSGLFIADHIERWLRSPRTPGLVAAAI
jgi:hypothetical protein